MATEPLLYDKSRYQHDKKEVSFIYECLFGGNLTSLARQIHYLMDMLMKYDARELGVPKIPVMFCKEGDSIQFSTDKIIVPFDVADCFQLAMSERRIGQMDAIKEQASIAIFLSIFALNKDTNIAHIFTANALTHYNIRRRMLKQTTLHQTEPLASDKLLSSLLKPCTSAKEAVDYLKTLSTGFIKYSVEPDAPLPAVQESSGKILTPAIIHSAQIIGLANNGFNIPPSIVTNAKRALTKTVNALFDQ